LQHEDERKDYYEEYESDCLFHNVKLQKKEDGIIPATNNKNSR
jgi:hypothetical protein